MPLSNLITDLIDDIHNPVILWQAGIIIVCIVLGWALSRLLRGAYAGLPRAQTLTLEVPQDAVTPGRLCDQNVAYQILHFAGPTSAPARNDDTLGEYWMNKLIEEQGDLIQMLRAVITGAK